MAIWWGGALVHSRPMRYVRLLKASGRHVELLAFSAPTSKAAIMTQTRYYLLRMAGVATLLAAPMVSATSGLLNPASASTPCPGGAIVVSTAADSGTGSMRAAFAAATTANGGTICVDATVVTSPISVTSGVLTYSGSGALTIDGNGATLQGDHSSGIITDTVSGQLLKIDSVTITGGHASSGGAISTGGGGPTTISNSNITGNTADNYGGGVSASDVTIINTTISNNTAGNGGGGGFSASTLSAINSTITGNSDPVDVGGGASVYSSITLVYTTVTDNTGTQGANLELNSPSGVLTSFGSVVASPHGATNCHQASAVSHGYNFSDDATCGFTNTAQGDQQTAGDPGLGALANNGGPTPTRAPNTGSLLLDAIPTAACQADGATGITTDQRGVTRPQQGGCDIGSVEIVAPPVSTTTTGLPSATTPTPVAATPAFTG